MFRGNWRIILAVVGWLILCGAQPPAKQTAGTENAKQAAQAPQVTSTPTPTSTDSPTTQFTAYPGYNPDPCYNAKDKDAADLCAQWRAALAAEKAAYEARRATSWSIIATFLSAIGLCAVIWSLLQTEGALGEARRGNKIAEDSARRTLRAYVAATDFEIEDFTLSKRPRSVWLLRNLGTTPAFTVQILAAVFITGKDEKICFSQKFVISRDVHPGESFEVPYRWPIELNPVLGTAFQNDTSSFIYAGIIRYKDAFGVRHYTTFKKKVALQSLKEGGGDGPMINCIRGNRAN